MKTIRVSDEVHEALRKRGEKGQSFDEILREILEKVK